MAEPKKNIETPAGDAAQAKKPSRWKKGLLIGAFTLAVGGLIYDNLSLRLENYLLGAAVVELYEENMALKEHLMQGGEAEGDSMPAFPREQSRIIQVSSKKAPGRPSI